jgi:Tfp pilus assembly protein FimT
MTLLEVLIVLSVGALLMLIGFRPLRQSNDRVNARGARVAVAQNVALARAAAVARGCAATFNVDTATGKSWVTACTTRVDSLGGLDTVGLLDNTERRFGVQIVTSSPSIVYDPRGLSLGGGNKSYRFVSCTRIGSQSVCDAKASDSFYVNAIGKVMR